MQKYKIKRAGREFVVYSGDSQILKCATRHEARKAIIDANGDGPAGGSIASESLGGRITLQMRRALRYLRDISRSLC
jgi:hypothetical protein